MKNYIIFIFLAILISVTSGCTKNSSQAEDSTPPEIEASLDDNASDENIADEEALSNVSLEITTNKIENSFLLYNEEYELVNGIKNEKIQSHINETIKASIANKKNRLLQDDEVISADSNQLFINANVSGKAIYLDESILSYEIIYTESNGADSEISSNKYLNFDLKTGQQIKFLSLLSREKIYNGIEIEYLKNFSPPFVREFIWIDEYDNSYFFTNPKEITLKLPPYTLDYEQKDIIDIKFSDLNYNFSNSIIIGAVIKDAERIETTPYYKLYFAYPELENDGDFFSSINQSIANHVEDYYKFSTDMAILDHVEDEFPPYWFNIDYSIFTNTEKILSFGLFNYQYTGGAHGLSAGFFYNYDLEKKLPLKISDLFPSKFDYKTYINDQIYRKIESEIKSNPDSYYSSYDFKGITDDVKFYINDNQLVIFFDQYEIAPYAAGTPTFKITLP